MFIVVMEDVILPISINPVSSKSEAFFGSTFSGLDVWIPATSEDNNL